MSSPALLSKQTVFVPSIRERLCFAANRVNPLFPKILAFWALWHCRHARPPDTAFLATC
ncbi:hypothetical protein SAMN05216255_3964 [Pseudomonas segetis]|uniref:Uncharacterized protein n=1 Tax=Pseudomonas segetis TaxID=298908 RepID=A0A239IMU3_9PSED|nr:hypothetical protein SAMN05216255_3964 [Pseudomonas segetis]